MREPESRGPRVWRGWSLSFRQRWRGRPGNTRAAASAVRCWPSSRDRVLLGSRENCDGLDEFAVRRHPTVVFAVDPNDVGQSHSVDVVGLRPGHGVPFTVTGDGHRVDRVDPAPGGAQCGDHQTARGFDRDRDRILAGVTGLGQQCGEFGESGGVVADSLLGHEFSLVIDDRDVVMPFGPVDSAVSVQSDLHQFGCFRRSETSARTRSALLTSLCGLASDELFAIPAHPHGTVLSKSLKLSKGEASDRASRLEPRAIRFDTQGRTAPTRRVGGRPSLRRLRCARGLTRELKARRCARGRQPQPFCYRRLSLFRGLMAPYKCRGHRDKQNGTGRSARSLAGELDGPGSS